MTRQIVYKCVNNGTNITQAVWFDTLFLKNYKRIRQAQDFFTIRPHLGKQVQHLLLVQEKSIDFDRELRDNIIRLPDLLPNIKTLKCIEQDEPGKSFGYIASTYDIIAASFKRWNKLTSLIEQSVHLNFTFLHLIPTHIART